VFYTHNLGIPELREAWRSTSPIAPQNRAEQIAVTTAGVNALMVASQLLIDPGDRVVQVTPLWPKPAGDPEDPRRERDTVPLGFRAGLALDLAALLRDADTGTERCISTRPTTRPAGRYRRTS
jgi:aspartate/methionine/tyrosine aminotransferase